MTFQNIPYLYQNKNGSFRVLGKGTDEYFKATEKSKAVKFAKNLQKNLNTQLKGFITRQELQLKEPNKTILVCGMKFQVKWKLRKWVIENITNLKKKKKMQSLQ